MLRTCFIASLLALTSGCALLTKADPLVPRYYTPETLEVPDVAPVASAGAAGLSIRLGRIGGSSYLKERIAYRDSDHEVGFYEDKRWTERPEVYLLRAMERALYEERGLKRALASSAPTLTADLVEFEEVRTGAPRVRLRVSYALHDEQTVFRERSLSVERPIAAGPDASRTDRVAAALGDALHEVVKSIVDEVVADLAAQRAQSAQPANPT
jgi:cholesterol transport system auxiliary component